MNKTISFKNKVFWGYLEGFVSVILNILLFLFKYWVGVGVISVAIIADAWHTLSDTLTSLVVILGFKISSKPADKQHPFGHGRAEIVASVIIGMLLAVVGFNFLGESIQKFRSHTSALFNQLAVNVFIISVILKEALAQFSFWAGRRIDSQSLIADGWHHRSDAIASLLILTAMIFGKSFWWIDSIFGMAVSLLIIYVTYDILKASISSLLGEKPDENLQKKIEAIVASEIPYDIKLHHLHLHRYGDHGELTFHILLSADMSLRDAHKIADNLEGLIRDELGIDATIHIEPQR